MRQLTAIEKKQVFVCLPDPRVEEPWTIAAYKKADGYKALENVLKKKVDQVEIQETLKTGNLRGRGGAGFPAGVKWSFMPRQIEGPSYIVCNSDEGEPGTCKDRDILRFNPHSLVEGMIIAGYSMGCSAGYNYIRGEFNEPIDRFNQAIEEARAAGYLGKNILGTGFDFELYSHSGAGAYICG
ncbi:MAG: NADH-quinone oxidoreductase subunit F, partial [Parvicella sp.]